MSLGKDFFGRIEAYGLNIKIILKYLKLLNKILNICTYPGRYPISKLRFHSYSKLFLKKGIFKQMTILIIFCNNYKNL